LLANGSTIYLDSAANGIVTNQGNVQLVKVADGSIAYDGATSEIMYNTLTNPRGSKVINITFSDGTRVWLNAGSSITYPMVFVGHERKVTVTGEAFFDVTHKAGMPFRVCKGDLEVTVLGTQFNVNAYDDEDAVKVTLLKGSVKILRPAQQAQAIVIKPGQQAVVTDKINVDDNIDLEEVMAWKNGTFQFGDKIDVQSLMRQVARWYDVEIEYKGNVNGFVGGSISRDVNISKVIEMLEKTGEVKFKIEGKKITVMK
jgi:ferric-dicitrate binding protein FerR (iron transport regulator)